MDDKIIWLLCLTVLILVKDALIPLLKKANGRRRGNPINIDRLYQEFKDFKETQEKWNDKIEKEIEKLEERRE